jgi:small subunit ribosomal protein S3
MAYTAVHIIRPHQRPQGALAGRFDSRQARRRSAGPAEVQPQRGARLLEKVLKSALGNAEDRRAPNVGASLVVTDARVDGGPMFKRIQVRVSRGMAYMIKRRMSHIRVADDVFVGGVFFRVEVKSQTSANGRAIELWVRKSIPSASAPASWSAGRAAGMPRRRNSATCCSKTRSSAKFIKTKYKFAGIPKIEIERTRDEVKVVLHTARPGVIIGRKGQEVERLQAELAGLVGRRINIKIEEIGRPEIQAQLVAEDIAEQLAKRASFRRTMKRAMETTMEAGAKGIKIQLAGRLGGAEMARREKRIAGSMPLSTLRAKIDYGFTEAMTPQGNIGVQVWVNQGMYEDDSQWR